MSDHAPGMTPEETIRRIAEIAQAVASQAGVGAMETAGQLVSVLAVHPEKIAGLLSGEINVIDDDALLRAEAGCLSWHARNGKIVSPAEARKAKQQHDH